MTIHIFYVCAAEYMNSAKHSGICRGCPEESPEKISRRYHNFKGPVLDVVRKSTLIMGITAGRNSHIVYGGGPVGSGKRGGWRVQ